MSRNFYSEINLHIVWHVLQSAPTLDTKIESIVHHAIRGRCINTPGLFIHAVGGTETHVHLALTAQPTILISEFIGQLKGFTAHEVNQKLGHKVLEWQTGYGVVSFGTRDLPWVVDYILNQREHHQHARVHDRLERVVGDG